MLYCSRCQFLCTDERCPQCGNKKLRQPLENDPVYLLTCSPSQSYWLESVLNGENIPFERDGNRGAALTLFSSGYAGALQSYRFFVPFGAYQRCRDLADDVLESLSQTEKPLEQDE